MSPPKSPWTRMQDAGVIPLPDQQLLLESPLRLLRGPSGPDVEWISTRHVFASAFPRSHHACTAPPSAPIPEEDASRASQSKEEERSSRKQDFQLWEEMGKTYAPESLYPASSQEEANRLAEYLAQSNKPQLWTCIERIVPRHREDASDGITLVFAHANGFHKEIYEPAMQSLISHLNKHSNAAPKIAEIWSLDTFDSGDSGALNEGHLGQITSWLDHPRDILQFLDYYLPERGAKDLATPLELHAQGLTRKSHNLVGIGHSFSGAGMSMLNSLYPDLLAGLILMEPVGAPIEEFPDSPVLSEQPLSRGAVARKQTFANRQAVADSLGGKPYFQSWDSRVLKLHIDHGFRPLAGHEQDADPPVRLSMSKWNEALAFSTSFLGSLHYAQVKRSRFKGWAHLICADEKSFIYGYHGPKDLMQRFTSSFSTSGRASAELMMCGHLIPQEMPDALGARLAEIIAKYEKGNNQNKSKARL